MLTKKQEPETPEDRRHVGHWIRFACECNLVPELAQVILVEWNPRFTRRLGDGGYNRHSMGARVRLSLPLWPRASEADRRETVIHETCHVIIGYKFGNARHHGPEWKEAMKNCGVEPQRTHSVDRTGLARRQKQFILLGCPHSELAASAGSPLAKLICFGGVTSSTARSATCISTERRSSKKFGRQHYENSNAHDRWSWSPVSCRA